MDTDHRALFWTISLICLLAFAAHLPAQICGTPRELSIVALQGGEEHEAGTVLVANTPTDLVIQVSTNRIAEVARVTIDQVEIALVRDPANFPAVFSSDPTVGNLYTVVAPEPGFGRFVSYRVPLSGLNLQFGQEFGLAMRVSVTATNAEPITSGSWFVEGDTAIAGIPVSRHRIQSCHPLRQSDITATIESSGNTIDGMGETYDWWGSFITNLGPGSTEVFARISLTSHAVNESLQAGAGPKLLITHGEVAFLNPEVVEWQVGILRPGETASFTSLSAHMSLLTWDGAIYEGVTTISAIPTNGDPMPFDNFSSTVTTINSVPVVLP